MLRKAVGLDKQVPRGLWYVFSTSTSSSSSGSRYFSGGGKENEEGKAVENDDDLDGYWKGMESRVSNSAFRKRKEGSIGRGRVPRTDEDVWGEAGLYQCSPPCPRYEDAQTPITCDHSCKKRSWQK